jgi:colanic acid biosynthesis glycosyl transferase WcaI
MGAKQGLENVVAAARHAASREARVRFVLLGDGGRRRHLESIGRDVAPLTFLDPLPAGAFEDALSAADVLLLNEATSVAEMSAPSKLTSYFTAGRPVVAATAPSSAASTEIARSEAGIRVDTGDPVALYDAVVALGRDPVRAAAMGARGRGYAEKHLSAAAAAASYCRWVEELAARR